MLNQLHNEIDAAEDLVAKAKTIVEETVKSKLIAALHASDSSDVVETFGNAMTEVATAVADALANLTTEAVQQGAENARLRYEASQHD